MIDESEDEEEEQQLRTVAHVSRFENQYTISNIVASVITNFSQDDQHVADLFNDLGKNTALNVRESYLWKVLHDVGAYYSSCWASMIRTYVSSPWSCILSVLCFCLVNAYHGTICNVCFQLLA